MRTLGADGRCAPLRCETAVLVRHPGCGGVAAVLEGLLQGLAAVDGVAHAQHLWQAPTAMLQGRRNGF